MDTSDIINIILAIYGAFLTTYIYKKSLIDKKRKLVFSHEFETLKTSNDILVPSLLLRVNNGGGKNIDLTEIGFTSKGGRIVAKKGSPTIATIEPGESYSFSFNLIDHANELNVINGYYAKDSFGDEHHYSLLTPLLEQLKNSYILKSLYDMGYRHSILQDLLDTGISNYNKKLKVHKSDMEKLFKSWEEEDARFEIQRKEWDLYEKETGKIHPERERNLKKILENIQTNNQI